MRAAICRAYGPPEVLTVEDVAPLSPKPGEAIVTIEAASVNFPDVLFIANRYQISVPVPFTPGSEFAGTVRAVGEGVDRSLVGRRVAGSVMVGAYAEEVAVAAAGLKPLPDGVDIAEAAAFFVVYQTSFHALRSVAAVRPGDWVCVLGAGGGVGMASIDIARVLGARVLAVSGSNEKLEICRARGAEALVNYTEGNTRDLIKERSGGGVDVVIDPVGGPLAEQALRACRRGGRFVTIGYASGEIPAIPLNLVLLKAVTIAGLEIRTFGDDHPEQAAANDREVLAHFAAGRLRPHVGATFALTDVRAALEHVAAGKAVGKIVIDPRR